MCLTNCMEEPPPNIRPQGAPLDDLVVHVMAPMISRLAHVDPRTQVSRTGKVSSQESQFRPIAMSLGCWCHDPTTDTSPTLVSAQINDETRLVVGHGQEHRRIDVVPATSEAGGTQMLGCRGLREIRWSRFLEALRFGRCGLACEPEGEEPIHAPCHSPGDGLSPAESFLIPAAHEPPSTFTTAVGTETESDGIRTMRQ
jgi:hypothetical protein